VCAGAPMRVYDRRNVDAIICRLTNFEIHSDSKAESCFLIFDACIMLRQYVLVYYIVYVTIYIILTGLVVPDDFNVTTTENCSLAMPCHVCYVSEDHFALISGGPSSIPGTTRKKIVGLERGPLSLVIVTEELLERQSKSSSPETEITAVGIRHADHVAPSIRKLAITSPTSGGRSVGIVRSRTQTMEFSFSFIRGLKIT
jgi:hypothetical protein